MLSCLHCTVQLPAASLASVLSTKPLKASPNKQTQHQQKRVIEDGVPPPKNRVQLLLINLQIIDKCEGFLGLYLALKSG